MEPCVTIVPKRASIGSPVILSGTGFYPSDGPSPGEPIIVDFGLNQTLAIGYTDYYGTFEIPLKVPFCKGGENKVKVREGYSGLVAFSHFDITPRIEQFPQLAYPTKLIKIKGDGFAKFETLTLTLEKGREGTKTLVQKAIFLPDENGAFSFDFLIESQAMGVKGEGMKSHEISIGYWEKNPP